MKETISKNQDLSTKQNLHNNYQNFSGKSNNQNIYQVKINHDYERNLSAFGIAVLKDRYLLPNESSQELFARVACYYADNQDHAQR